MNVHGMFMKFHDRIVEVYEDWSRIHESSWMFMNNRPPFFKEPRLFKEMHRILHDFFTMWAGLRSTWNLASAVQMRRMRLFCKFLKLRIAGESPCTTVAFRKWAGVSRVNHWHFRKHAGDLYKTRTRFFNAEKPSLLASGALWVGVHDHSNPQQLADRIK